MGKYSHARRGTDIFPSLFNIHKAEMANIQSVVGADEYLDDNLDAEGGENNQSIKNVNAKLHCLFQIMTYHIHRGGGGGAKRHQCMSWLGTVHIEKREVEL